MTEERNAIAYHGLYARHIDGRWSEGQCGEVRSLDEPRALADGYEWVEVAVIEKSAYENLQQRARELEAAIREHREESRSCDPESAAARDAEEKLWAALGGAGEG